MTPGGERKGPQKPADLGRIELERGCRLHLLGPWWIEVERAPQGERGLENGENALGGGEAASTLKMDLCLWSAIYRLDR